jgi:YesN/AraC family two-component response regulator
MHKSRMFYIWSGMLTRSGVYKRSPKYTGWSHVGVFEGWKEFAAFRDWSIANGYDDTKTIDRIKNELGYSPDNCRWTDVKTQQRNKSSVKLSLAISDEIRREYSSGKITQRQLANRFGVNPSTVSRIVTQQYWS